MDGSDNGFSSSTSGKPSAIPKLSPTGEVDENDLNFDQMASKLQKPPTKHFMSPTISAASKAAAPSKKILAERNQALNFSDTHHHHNAPNLDSKFSPVNLAIDDSSDRSWSRLMPVSNRVSESDDDEQNSFVSDSSSKPYDPLRNYLSPRPKFLRYKPNRRCEIFLGQETERRERKDGYGVKRSVSFDSQRKEDSSEDARSSSSQDSPVKQEDDDQIDKKSDESDDADEEEVEEFEEEEEEEEKCLNLKAVLKFLLVFVTLVLSTLFISSMNSPTPSPSPSPSLQAPIRGLKDGYYKIHNHTLEVLTVKIFEGRYGSLVQGEGIKIVSDDGSEEGLVESTDELSELVEMQNGKNEDVCDQELDEAEEVPETDNGEDDVYDAELEKKERCSVGFHQEETAGEGSDQLKGVGTAEIAEKSESFQDYRLLASSIKDEPMEGEAEIETIRGISISIEGAGKEVAENSNEKTDREIIMPGGLDNEANTITQREENSVEVIIEPSSTTESIPVTVIGIVLFFMIMGTSVLGFRLRRKKTAVKQSLSIEKPISKSVLAEKISSVEPVFLNVEGEHTEKVESLASPSQLISSIGEPASKEFYQIRAPTVELIGEFVVGEVGSSSIKSCGMKSKTLEVEEESNNSDSQGKEGPWSKAHAVVSSQAQPSASKFSSMNSSSYGSFTAEKKIVRRREEGKDGEVKTVITTPVRRSSRIHNRALSP